jgi:hypothetical protein
LLRPGNDEAPFSGQPSPEKREWLKELVEEAVCKRLRSKADREWVNVLRKLRYEVAHESNPSGGPSVSVTLLRIAIQTISPLYNDEPRCKRSEP